jgi:hypothetical protein
MRYDDLEATLLGCNLINLIVKTELMENRYTLFTNISSNTASRSVQQVIDDILTQRTEFSNDLNKIKPLDSQKTWLLQQLENQHKLRTSQAIDLSHHPLLLILELSAYLSRSKADELPNACSLKGAEIGAKLLHAYINAYVSWSKLSGQKLGENHNPDNLAKLAKEHGFEDENAAPNLASNLTSLAIIH